MKLYTITLKHICYKLTFIYLFFSVFEFYINATIGHISRYFMLLYTCILLIDFFLNKKVCHVSCQQFFLGCWLIYSCMSIIWSTNREQANVYVFTFVTMTVVLICVLNNSLDDNKINKLITFFQICSVLLCILGVFFSAPLLDDTTNDIRYVLYIGGVRPDPNYLLALYVISIQIGFYRLLNKKNRKLFNLISILLGSYVILYTGSRSGIVIIAVSLLIIGFSRLQHVSFTKKIGMILGATILLILIGYLAIQFIPLETLYRVFGIGDLKFMDGTGRIEGWIEDFSKWDNWAVVIFGMGFGSNTAHSTLITFLLEFGILGFSLFIIPVIALFLSHFKAKNSLAIAILIGGMIQAFLCPATNMRFFWNAMIVPALMLNMKTDDAYARGKRKIIRRGD